MNILFIAKNLFKHRKTRYRGLAKTAIGSTFVSLPSSGANTHVRANGTLKTDRRIQRICSHFGVFDSLNALEPLWNKKSGA